MSDASFDSTKRNLKTVLEHAQTGRSQLPDFQRGWVWDDDHIRDLLASISRSFPIGAVMMLEAGGDVRFKTRLIEGARGLAAQPENLILDGQQRLTSLFQSLASGQPVVTRDAKKNEITRWYYIDIEAALDPDVDRIDAILSVPEDRMIRKNFGRDIDKDYSTPEREYAAKVFPLAKVFDPFEWRAGFNQHWRYAAEAVKLWDRFEREVVARFSGYQLPIIELDKATPKEAVCLVFEKVNTGGVPLTVFELLTAQFAADGFDLREEWAKRKGRIVQRAPKLLTEVANTDFLQVVSLLASNARRTAALRAGLDGERAPQITCKRRDILRLTLEEYRIWADAAEDGIGKAARFLIGEHVYETRFLPYQTQIVPLAALHALLGSRAEQQAAREKLARWYWCGVFGELYGSAIETRFARDVLEIPGWIDGGDTPRTVVDANFAPERLHSLRTRGSAAYKGVYVMLLKAGAEDFRTGEAASVQNYFEEAVDIHHVFPQKWCNDNGVDPKVRESIVNKTPLTARTNRIIGGDAPALYLAKLKKNHGAVSSVLERSVRSHLIDPVPLEANDLKGFFERRQAALLEQISMLMGKRLESDPTDIAVEEEIEEGA